MSNTPTTSTTTPNAGIFPSAWFFEYTDGRTFFTREKEEAEIAKENPEHIVQMTEYFAQNTRHGGSEDRNDVPVANVFKAELFVARDKKQVFNTIVELPDADLKHGELLYRKQGLSKPDFQSTQVNALVKANTQLIQCLENMCSIAHRVDGWESFPSEPLDSAHRLIEEISAQIEQIQASAEHTQAHKTPEPDFADDLANEVETLAGIKKAVSTLAKIDLRVDLDEQAAKLLSNWIGDEGEEQPIVLWIGEAQLDDGNVYGLNVSSADYLDEGCEHLLTLPRDFLKSCLNN